jgi:hypothetical protein
MGKPYDPLYLGFTLSVKLEGSKKWYFILLFFVFMGL